MEGIRWIWFLDKGADTGRRKKGPVAHRSPPRLRMELAMKRGTVPFHTWRPKHAPSPQAKLWLQIIDLWRL